MREITVTHRYTDTDEGVLHIARYREVHRFEKPLPDRLIDQLLPNREK